MNIKDTKISGLQQVVYEFKFDGTDVPWIYGGGGFAAQIPSRVRSAAAEQFNPYSSLVHYVREYFGHYYISNNLIWDIKNPAAESGRALEQSSGEGGIRSAAAEQFKPYGSLARTKNPLQSSGTLLDCSCGEEGKETLLPNNSLSISYNP